MYIYINNDCVDQKCQHQTVTCQLAGMSTDNCVLVTTAVFVRAMDSTKRYRALCNLDFCPVE